MSRSSMEPKRTEPTHAAPSRVEPSAPASHAPPVKKVVRIGRVRMNRWTAIAAGAALLLVVLFLARGASRRDTKVEIQFEPVSLRDISLTVEATGAVEPIDLVEVKSKASGQIIEMPVQVGSLVRKGDLLAQIDTRDVQNQYDQSLAALRAAQSRVNISLAQKRRSDNLYAQAVITAPEHEAATLDYANAQAQLVKARTDLDLSRQRREDATVRAPIAGTIIEQTVNNGQVISSATSSASGGTTLLKMADLSRIRVRALVAESDVGNVHPGQTATVTVDAFPNRVFQGTVEKIEPQAVVQQSVTMFPVLIAISNEDGLLLPGMNGEVSMLIEERQDVPAIPVDAVRSAREMPAVASLLGLKPEKVKEELDRQIAARARDRQTRFAGGDSLGARRGSGEGRGALAAGGAGGDSSRGRSGWRRGAGGGGGEGRQGRGSGQWSGRGRAGGGGGASAGRAGSGSGGGAGGGGLAAGGAAGGGDGADGGAGGGGGMARRAQAVLVKTANGVEPRLVRLGLSDFDYTQVVDGLAEGEQVALLSVAEAQADRQQRQSQLRQRMGSGLPGQPAAGGGGRGAGGGGGRGGGGGGR